MSENRKGAILSAISAEERRKRKNIFEAIGWGLLILLALLFSSGEQLYSLAYDLETDPDTVQGWLTFIIIVSSVVCICCIGLAGRANGEIEKLRKEYRTLESSSSTNQQMQQPAQAQLDAALSDNAVRCIFCGSAMSDEQTCCKNCGRRRD